MYMRGRRRPANKHSEKNTYESKTLSDVCKQICNVKMSEGLTKETIDRYRRVCESVEEFAEIKGLSTNVESIDVEFARQYMTYILHEKKTFKGHRYKPESVKTPGCSPKYANDHLKTMRAVFTFCIKENMISENPFQKINKVKQPEPIIQILSVEEMKQLLKTPNKRKFSEFRDYVVMMCLINSMCRIGEIVTLEIENINFELSYIILEAQKTKTRKGRMIPLDKNTMQLLKKLLLRNTRFKPSKYVFITEEGTRLTTDNFRKRLADYAHQAGINKRVHPHLFRHTAASMFLQAGGDLRHLQTIIGHKDLRMVLRYTHLSLESLARQQSEYSLINQVVDGLNKPRKTKRKYGR
ncbi:tyrosine-type recombinase/integrase [Bacillus licheniformis]|uniref:tyrosine-type recombinase/integrase n=1 Tax=Bacillus licheniformis TaxID=1402 RepID=UPI0011A249B5|nr:tyrosine-type recombinase/integrase [Bacillus licheniformis]MCA1183026.1 tyrosine-type recombinase/integrase [Bacillus licheniformis]MCM3209159.1 tyrosine-type recombinase/integrase [Bacillus licheniformis]MCM3284767.1 tyrosine-type recombinase/integrase [Bacillus licheniformis]MCY7743842.1 tyrosine-type recombinase/integrase [Bacillus licheniformis]MCY7775944.1 tyrosine-type recombinase/integrase [Bacillus licheniformis]